MPSFSEFAPTLISRPPSLQRLDSTDRSHRQYPRRHNDHNSLDSLNHNTHSQNQRQLKDLPYEVLYEILKCVINDESIPNVYTRLNNFRKNILPVAPSIHDVGMQILYEHVPLGLSASFDRLLRELENRPEIRPLVKSLDFSDFTSVGLGRTGRMNQEIQMVTAKTITRALELCPQLNDFLASESIQNDIDAELLTTLFSLPQLKTVDFCGATGVAFAEAFANADLPDTIPSVTRLSFHECYSLPPDVFVRLLSRFPKLTHLDVTHTQITGAALESICDSVHLTHLSISRCYRLSGYAVSRFLLSHPASQSLQWLNLNYDSSKPTPVTESQLDVIIRYMPQTVRSLQLSGLPVTLSHLAALPRNIEALSIGYSDFKVEELVKVLGGKQHPIDEDEPYYPGYDNLTYLELTGVTGVTLWTLQEMELLRGIPSVILWEFSSSLLSKVSAHNLPGFTIAIGQGRRAWLVRNPINSPNKNSAMSNNYERGYCTSDLMCPSLKLAGLWSLCGRKIDCSTTQSGLCHERGIYLYYSYRR